MTMDHPTLSDIPVEVLLDNLFPVIPVPDLLRLVSTNKFFAELGADDTLWKRKLDSDFNFTGEGTARTTGWKFIYRGLSKPRVFVWGERANGRLGLSRFPRSSTRGVPFPTQLRIPGVSIVNLVAGGMSFHALDSDGNVHVWGALDGTTAAFRSDGFSDSSKRSDTPVRLKLPAPVRSISCGRLHSSCLDRSNRIWTFVSWGRPFFLSSQLLSDPGATPAQIECGWGFSSLLTKSGEVFIWWPFSGHMQELIDAKNTEMDNDGDKKALLTGGVIPCVTWALKMDPVRLPSLPPLPQLSTEEDGEERQMTELVKIAALDGHIIGLTNHGHVVKFGCLDNETTVSQGRWEYLPKFSEVERLQEHPAFSGDDSSDDKNKLTAPETMKITHISTNFLHFIAYSTGSSSVVLIGDTNTTPDSDPKIIPTLQHKSIISVVLGDYHNAALTAFGKLLTWGAYSAGALGLGDPAKLEPGTAGAFATDNQRRWAADGRGTGEPPAVEEPTEVRFDHDRKKPKDRFCFSAAAAGWHTGALVIDLEPDNDDEDSENYYEGELENLPPPHTIHSPWQSPPIIPLPRIFRVGYAGRGLSSRGRGMGITSHQVHHAEGSSNGHAARESSADEAGRQGGDNNPQ